MADIIINHIAGLEVGGHLARAVYAEEVNFSTLALTVTNKQKTSNTCRLTISNTISPFLFVGQRINPSIGDSNFDGTAFDITAVNSASKWFEYVKAGPDVASTAASGTATPTYAFGLSGGNVFPINNTIASAGDSAAGKNKVQLSGKRAVYYGSLSNAVSGLSDTIDQTFALEKTMRSPNLLLTTVDDGFLVRQASGTNIGDCLIIALGKDVSQGQRYYYWDESAGTKTELVSTTHWTGTRSNQFDNSNKNVIRVEFVKNGSGKLQNIRGTVGGVEFMNINILSSWQLSFPLNIGDAAGQTYNTDTIANKVISDLVKLYK